MTITLRLLGGFDVAVDGVPVAPEQWTRRQAASLVKVLALAPGPPAAPRAGDRGAVARARASRPPVRDCTRRPTTRGVRSAATGSAVLLRNDMVALLPEGDVQHRRRRVPCPAHARRSRRVRPRPRRPPSRRTAGRCCPRTSTRPGPTRRASRSGRLHVDLLRRAERWDDVLERGPDRRDGPPGADPRPHRPGRRTRCAAAVRAPRPRPAARARHHRRARRRSGCARGCTPSSGRAEQPSIGHSQGVRLVGRREVGDQIRDGDGPGRRGPGQRPCCSPGCPVSARPPCSGSPRRSPASGTGAPAAAPPRRSRAPGPTRRCWRRSASCAASTPRCSTASTTASALEIERASRAVTSAGPVSPATSGCSSRWPS